MKEATLRRKETPVIDLTDDLPSESSTTVPVIVSVNGSRPLAQPSSSRRRKSGDSDVVILEDEACEDVIAVPPPVACHFFYPSVEEGGEARCEVQDPLAPAPEWVDCSTLHSEQVTVDDELLVLESLPEQDTTSFAYVDPLCMAEQIKTEPGTEADVKPSLAQLSKMASTENREFFRSKNFDSVQQTNTVIKQEPLDDGHSSPGKRKPSGVNELNDMSSPKRVKTGMKIGPQSAQFRQEEKQRNGSNSKLNSSYDSELSGTPLQTNIRTVVTFGPKSAKSRQKENGMSVTNSNQNNSFDPELSNMSPSTKNITKVKNGPKCAKLRQEEEQVNASNSKFKRLCDTELGGTSPQINIRIGVKVGPKCAKFRRKQEINLSNYKLNSSYNTELSSTPSKTNLKSGVKAGPKCAQFRQKQEMSASNYKLNSSYDTSLSGTSSQTNIKSGVKAGPKCAKFRQKQEMSASNSKSNSSFATELTGIHPLINMKTERKVGPKCAKFRQKQQEVDISKTNTKQTYLQYSYENGALLLTKTNLNQKVGPKCSKIRGTEEKATSVPHSNYLENRNSLFKSAPQENEEKDPKTVIKPAVVMIGPKLPLPQCFHQDTGVSLSQETSEEGKSELENYVDKSHIVLKIYTCFKCNHKCTDPLFHEEHVIQCTAKRRCKSVDSSQDSNKHNDFYKCEICPFKFKNQKNLSNHMKQHGAKGFICHICQQTLITIHQLHQHSATEHKNLEKVFSCNTCEYSSLNIHHLREHMLRHNADRHLFCNPCRQNFEDTEDIEKHKEEYHSKTRVKSEQKNRTNRVETNKRGSASFSRNINQTAKPLEIKGPEDNEAINSQINEDVLSDNWFVPMSSDTKCPPSFVSSFEKQIIRRNGNYYCNGCLYKFFHLKNLIKHKKHHLTNKPFRCCNSSFVSLSCIDYSKHIQEKHNRDFNYSCSMCPLKFKANRSLMEHMVKHVKDGLFCYQCRKNMENANVYRSHMSAMHANMSAAKYTCVECSFITYLPSALKRHKRISHSEKKKTKEMQSGKIQFSEAGVNENIKGIKERKEMLISPAHPDQLKLGSKVVSQQHVKFKQGSEDEGFRCNQCTFKCSQASTLIKHMKNGHKKRKFVCNVCRNDFAFSKLYLNHMKNHAACAVIYSCNECRFTSKKELIFGKHMRTHSLKRCPLCDFKTDRPHRLESHLESVHTVGDDSSSDLSNDFQNQNFAVESKQNKETLDSTLTKDITNPHACCFCTFKTSCIQSLRCHMAVHFRTNCDSENEKSKPSSKTFSKPSLTVEKWKNKTQPSKTLKRGLPKVFKHGKTMTDSILLYCCTRCEFKSRDRKTVALHLLRKHNTKGAVRNSTITKIYVKVPYAEGKNLKTNGKNGNSKDSVERLEKGMKSNVQNKSLHNKSMIGNHTDKKTVEKIGKSNSCFQSKSSTNNPWRCSSCDLQKLSLLAQLQHKKYGHMGFWSRPFSCKICGFRCADKGNFSKHLKWKHKKTYEEEKSITNEIQECKKKVGKQTNEVGNNVDFTGNQDVKKYKRLETGVVECQDCNIESFPEAARRQHSTVGHDVFWGKSFPCDICKMRFFNKGALTNHNFSHRARFFCNKCNRNFSPKLKKLHERMCSGLGKAGFRKEETTNNHSFMTQDLNSDDDENYVCGECDFVTTNIIEFSTHMIVHSGIPDD